MHLRRFGEGERLPNEPRQALPQRVVEPLDVGCLPGLLSHRRMLIVRDDLGVSFPEVAVAVTLPITLWDRLPQLLAGLGTPIPQSHGHDLTGRPAHRQPDPDLVYPSEDEAPELIQFQDLHSWVQRVERNEGLL